MSTPVQDKSVSFVLLPGFALTSFAVAIETLSVANHLSEQQLYRYQICAPDTEAGGTTIVSSNGVPISLTAPFSCVADADLVIVCAYAGAARYRNRELSRLLVQLSQRQTTLAAISSGAFILAQAGILKGRSCTLNPEHQTSFRELYPDIPIQENLFTVTGHLLTSAGGTATLDMMLYLIGRDQGKEFIAAVAREFMQDRIRSQDEVQSVQRRLGLRIKSASLGAAVELMERNIAQPYSIAKLADRIGTSQRNLEMVFRKHAATTPTRYYLQLRLQHAKRMLHETPLSLSRIAQATGFSSQSHFSKCFREQFGVRPSDLRED